ncbi:unnamed protein product [Paramecium sonneborni]|uniref:Uncharacterized protein n=1 Tax=Paramecium sonneborni TaxID=65129 RepID=A0A8S1QGU1_9CILI|nr:unnamed protein product [Paramecium sonneborni]
MIVILKLFLILIIELTAQDCLDNFQKLDDEVEYTDYYIDTTDYQPLESYSYSFWIKYTNLDPQYKINVPDEGYSWCGGYEFIIWSQTLDYDMFKISVLMLRFSREKSEFRFLYSDVGEDDPLEVIFQQDSQRLDNQWIYFRISYYPYDYKVVIQKDSDINILNVQTIYSGYIQSTLGYDNFIVIANTFFVVEMFPGYLTNQIYNEKQITQNDYFYPDYINCKLEEDSQEVTKIFVDGLQHFNSGLVIVDKLLMIGEKYIIQGWVKLNLDFVTITDPLSQLLMRITINSYYMDATYQGDRTFYYRYNIYKQNVQNSNIYVETSHYKIPYQCYQYNRIFGEIEDFEKWQYEEEQLFNLIQEWHFFIFEHGRGESLEESSCIYLYFTNRNEPIKHCFGSENQKHQYSNGYYYIYIGEDDYINKKLIGSISDLTIKYNYNDLQEIKINCHFSCSTCNGPTANNCLLCDQELNRIYDIINRSCVCLKNYMQVDKNKKCQSIQEIFPFSQESQISTIYEEQCEFGYFKIPKDNAFTCKKCPFEIINNIYCLDCYEYSNTWYSNTICTSDFIQQDRSQDQGYIMNQRSETEYEVFLLDVEDNLIYFEQYKYICNDSDIRQGIRNCVQLKQKNLKQDTFVECSSNYYYQDGDCIRCQSNCLKCTQNASCYSCIPKNYIKNGKCFNCPANCNQCYYDELLEVELCQFCDSSFALIRGTCQKCGNYCQTCIEDFDSESQLYFNRCIQCIDSSKYYISIRGKHCLENLIENCLYAFEYIETDDIKINTLDYKFQINSQLTPTVSCARCIDNFGVDQNNFCSSLQNLDFVNCIFSAYLITNQSHICILGAESRQTNQCAQTTLSCQTCLYQKSIDKNFCIDCLKGYYADRLTGLCFQCPKSLFCNTCTQQMKETQNYWQTNIMNFYETIINKDGLHSFQENAQSQSNQDYEVICTSCINQYILINNLCIKSCPEDCAQCILKDNQFICLKCIYESQGRMLTIYNNQCLKCPQNCKVCRNRSQIEITSLNPFFQNQNYIMYSRQCLIPSNHQLQYNKEYGIFLNCNINGPCENHMLFQINLYCDFDEYQNVLIQNQNNLQFLQGNAYIEDLLKNNFSLLSNDLLYQHANEAQISTLIIQINSKKSQNCFLDQQFIISQNFQQHIFTLKTVKIEIIGQSLLTIQLSQNLKFENFQNVLLQNIKFVIAPNVDQLVQIVIQSLIKQKVEFQNLTFTSSTNNLGCSIQILNAYQIKLQNIVIIDYKHRVSQGFLNIHSSDRSGFIQIIDFQLINADIQDSSFIQFQTSKNYLIEIQNIFIQSILYGSQFIVCISDFECGKIKITNFEFQNSLSQNSLLFQLDKFIEAEFTHLFVKEIEFQNSTLMQFIQIFTLSHLTLKDSKIFNSILIKNILQANLDKYIYTFQNIEIISNYYNKESKLIIINRFTAQESLLIIKGAKFISNHLDKYLINENLKQINQSLIILQCDKIILQNIIIWQSNGLPIISFINSQHIEINNLYITTSNETKQLIQNQQLDTSQLGLILQFFAAQFLDISEIVVQSVILSNYPLISYESITNSISQQNEQIKIKKLQFNNNIIIFDSTRNSVCLFEIISKQNITAIFEDAIFQNNILLHKNQGQKQRSATLLYFDCLDCKFQFYSNKYISNVVINASVSIIYVKSKELIIFKSLFSSNGRYNTDINKLLRTFQITIQDQMINQESANGIFNCQNLKIYNSLFEFSYGSLSSAFYFLSSQTGNLDVKRTIFQHNSNLYFGDKLKGGSIYIEGNNHLYYINLEDNIFKNISSQKGGALQIQNTLGISQIFLKNILIEDVNSLYGTIIFAILSNQFQSQSSIQIINVTINNSFSSYAKYQTFVQDSFSNKANDNIFLYRSMIYSEHGKLIVNNMNILQAHQETIIMDQFIKGLILQNLYVQNTNYSYYGLIFISPDINEKTEILIKKLSVSGSLKSEYINPSDYSIQGLINLQNLNEQHYLIIEDIQLQKIDCDNCYQGLFNIYGSITSSQQIIMRRINLRNNLCGLKGCINVFQFDQIQNNQSTNRLLQQIDQNASFPYSIQIQNYFCNGNQANNGVCLRIKDFSIILEFSQLINNKAIEQGGAIVFQGRKAIFTILNSIIANNVAKVGGGIYYIESFSKNYTELNSYISNNSATYFGDDTTELPNQIKINIQNHLYSNKQTHFQNKIIDQVLIQENTTINQSFIKLPSAQPLHLYEQFDWKNNNYKMINYTLRLIPFDQKNNRVKNLTNSKCSIQGRLFDFNKIQESEMKQFNTNFTNFYEVSYNTQIEDYNFDGLIIYFDPDLPDNIVLQFEFKCDSIKIPIINENSPKNTIIEQSEEYYLRLNIKTLNCQVGELKNEEDLSCHPCDYTQDQYSVNFNQQKCKIRDNIQMESVKSAQLKLRPNFWRPYFYADLVENCYNDEFNCLGGWNYGDSSCSQGHIGALCEQCDLYNTRGEGSYSISSKFKCGSCDDTNANTFIIIGISLWTLISISISVKSTIEIIKQLARASKLKSIGITIVVTKNNAVNLIKILTNYLQIIASISTFQLQLPQNMESAINSLGNPIETMAYSLDCFLKDIFENISIHYSRTIWQLIMPIIYILLFFQLYGVGVIIKFVDFNLCVISTTLIYMFIYLQPNIIAGQIGLLSYRNISGYQWILGNVANRYDTENHMKWLISFSFPVLFTFGVLIPGLLFNRLFKIKDNQNNMQNRLIFGYLYNEYKGSAYYWEIIKIIQKELIIIFLTFYQDQILVKAVLVYGIIFIYNYLTLQIFPYQAMQLNVLDHQSTRICGFSIVLAIGIYGSLKNGILEVQIPFYIIMAIINFLFLAKLMLNIIKAYFQQFAIIIDKVRDLIRTKIPQLQEYPFFQKILKNQQQTTLRAQKNFRKIKAAVMIISKQIIQNKKTMTSQERKGTFLLEANFMHSLDRMQMSQTSIRKNNQIQEKQKLIQ